MRPGTGREAGLGHVRMPRRPWMVVSGDLLFKSAGHCTQTWQLCNKKPLQQNSCRGRNKSLAVTYFHMGKPHTIIGAEPFHFRVRDGIGWFQLANAARQTARKEMGTDPDFHRHQVNPSHGKSGSVPYFLFHVRKSVKASMLLDDQQHQLLRCYMVKPHGQLVLVSFTHYCASTPSLSTS